jgi:prolyl-tRNA synthetase
MKKDKDFGDWFDQLLINANIVDSRYPVKGFSVYRGWGYRIVQMIIGMLEKRLEETGHEPILFPVVIPEDAFAREAEHIAGFQAEVFWITHAGDAKLDRRLLLRPTSETAMYPIFSSWIRSHADLPLRVHQSVTIYRYETKATRPLLRMREFLWNEAHTAHRNWEDAEGQVREAVKIYDEVFKRLGLSYIVLQRPDFDKFPGAAYSLAFDAWNPDGKVNQIGTVHNLGENFAKAFEITYEDSDGNQRNVVQTCYGFGISRTLAAIIAQHGDDHGLLLPPEIAPTQVVIVPIPYKGVETEIVTYSKKIFENLKGSGFRAFLDDREKLQPGVKFYHWEMLGVPVRVEVGPRDLKENRVTLSRRDTLERSTVPFDQVVQAIHDLLSKIMENLNERSRKVLEDVIVPVGDIKALKRAIRYNFYYIKNVCW